jgi:hypothetical protein
MICLYRFVLGPHDGAVISILHVINFVLVLDFSTPFVEIGRRKALVFLCQGVQHA